MTGEVLNVVLEIPRKQKVLNKGGKLDAGRLLKAFCLC